MRRNINFSAAIAILIMFFFGCSKGHEDLLQSQTSGGCDTVNVSYQTDVAPIVSSNCYSCHGNGEINGGVNLDGYDNLKKQAENGSLVGAITHADGYTPMPLDQPKLSDCDINIITAWVNAGSPNN